MALEKGGAVAKALSDTRANTGERNRFLQGENAPTTGKQRERRSGKNRVGPRRLMGLMEKKSIQDCQGTKCRHPLHNEKKGS